MITIALLGGLKPGENKGPLSWTNAIRMSRFGQMLAAIFVLCLFINGLIFVMRTRGYTSVVVMSSDDMIPKPEGASGLQGVRNLKQQPEEILMSESSSQHSTQHINNAEGRVHGSTAPTEVFVNPHNYNYIINREDMCRGDPELIVVVCTSVKNFKERVAVRDTWGSYVQDSSHKTRLVFMLGQTDSEDLQAQLFNESEIFQDIIQEDFHDSYRNLSLKSVAMLKWVTNYCSGAMYLLKADDDMYINVPNLLKALRKQTKEKFILGHAFTGARPVQDKKSKWYTPLNDFNEKRYPRYTSGTSYSMSVKAVPDLYRSSQQIKTFWLEDIYITGLCARKAGIQQIHNNGFSYLKRSPKGCEFRSAITGHHYSPNELYTIHRELYDENLKC